MHLRRLERAHLPRLIASLAVLVACTASAYVADTAIPVFHQYPYAVLGLALALCALWGRVTGMVGVVVLYVLSMVLTHAERQAWVPQVVFATSGIVIVWVLYSLRSTVAELQIVRDQAEGRRSAIERLFASLPEVVMIAAKTDLTDARYVGGTQQERDIVRTVMEGSRIGTWRFWPSEEAAGLLPERSLLPSQLPLFRAIMGETVERLEVCCVRVGEETMEPIYFSISSGPVQHGPQGVMTGGISVIRDVSEQRRIAASKDEFISILGHELRTPLTVILGHVQIMQARISRAPATDNDELITLRRQIGESLERAEASINRMTGMVNNMLDLSRVQRGLLILEREEFDLAALAENVTSGMQMTTTKHTLMVSAPYGQPMTAYGDPRRIEQVIVNLLSNAIRYTAGGTICVQIKPQSKSKTQEIILAVSDEGQGIPHAEQGTLFERFRHNRDTRMHKSGGLGLGLYLCRQIIAAHGGRLWLDESGPEGSVFMVALPRTSAALVLRHQGADASTGEASAPEAMPPTEQTEWRRRLWLDRRRRRAERRRPVQRGARRS